MSQQSPPKKQTKADKHAQPLRYVRIHNSETSKVHGIQAMETPSVYIASIFIAFVLYHIDRKSSIFGICMALKPYITSLKQFLGVDPTDESSSIESIFVFGLSVTILCLVLAVKRVLKRKLVKERDDQEDAADPKQVSPTSILKKRLNSGC